MKVFPNKCDECWYCRPSNDPKFTMFCQKREIFKKNYRRCILWVSADDLYKNDESFLCAIGITDAVRAYQIGRANERKRILKQKEFSRMERIIQDMKESEDNHFLSEIDNIKIDADAGAEAVPVDIAEALETELKEARAEIVEFGIRLAHKDNHIMDILSERDEARAEIAGAIKLCGKHSTTADEGLYASLAISVGRLADQIERKDELIEQMQTALSRITKELEPNGHEIRGCMIKACKWCDARAALEAVERTSND